VGSIGAFTSGTSALFFGSLDTALLANSGNDSIHPWNASTNTNRDNAIDLGNAANRFKDLYLSGGVRATGSLDITIPETAGAAINMEFGNAANDTRRTVIFYKDAVWPAAADTTVINLGGPSNKFKDLYLSGGVYLGGTVAANLLDDYEEGTWTPVMTGSAGSAGSASTTVYGARYTKVGNLVTVMCHIRWADIGSYSGDAAISGLPFASANNGVRTAGSIDFLKRVELVDAFNYSGNIIANSSVVEISRIASDLPVKASAQVSAFNDNLNEIIFSCSYNSA
jgi:hypothetical protein